MGRKKSGRFSGIYYQELQNGDKSFYITYKNIDGTKVWEKIGLFSEGIRENYCNQIRGNRTSQIRNGELPPSRRKKDILTFEKAFQIYIEQIKNEKKSWKTEIRWYKNHLEKAIGKIELVKLTPAHFAKIRDEKISEKYASQTVIHILATARQVINYSIANLYHKYKELNNFTNPLMYKKVKFPKLNNEKYGVLTYEEAHKLLSSIKTEIPKAYHATVLMLFTGQRFASIADLTWHDIDLVNSKIYFDAKKGGKPVVCNIDTIIQKSIVALKEEDTEENNFVLKNADGQKCLRFPNHKQWQKIVDRLFPEKQINIKEKITPHNLRHTHGTWMRLNGADQFDIKDKLGHRVLRTTGRYVHNDDKKQIKLQSNILNSFLGNSVDRSYQI